MIQCLQFRKASFLGSDEWKTVPWELTTKDMYQKLLDKAFALAALLEQMDSSNLKGLSEKVTDFATYIRCLAGIDIEMDQWLQRYQLEGPSPLYWETNHSPASESSRNRASPANDGQAPSPFSPFAFPTFKIANTLIIFWALRSILSNAIAVTCAAILARMSANSAGPPSMYSDMQAKAQFMLSQHGDASRMMLATNILRSMPYFINDQMGIFGAQKCVFPLRVAMFSLRRHPGPHLRWGNDLYQRLHSKTGIRYAHEIAKVGGGPYPSNGSSRAASLTTSHATQSLPSRNERLSDVDEAWLTMSKLDPSTAGASTKVTPVKPA